MQAIGYIRVSTERQATEGLSLNEQRTRIRAYCRMKGWKLLDIISDPARSGKRQRTLADLFREGNGGRAGLARLVELCRAGEVKAVVSPALDRIARRVRLIRELVEDVFEPKGVAFVCLREGFDTSTATGRVVLNVLASIAEWEGDVISERIRDVLAGKKKRGERMGFVPFGFRPTGQPSRWEPVPEELAALLQAKRWRAKGLPYTEIARRWNEQGIKPRRGERWAVSSVFSLLNDTKRYRGLLGK